MLEFRKLLFPVDFSEKCIQSAVYFAGITRKFRSELHLLHVFGASGDRTYADQEASVRVRRANELESFGEKLADPHPICTVAMGDPAERIVCYAQENRVDTIVMPTHGTGRFRRLLLGSVTTKVLHDTSLPVWTTTHSETLHEIDSQNIRDMVCAIDLSPGSADLLRSASELAATYGATLHLTHAVPAQDTAPYGIIKDAPFQQFLLETAKERVVALQQETQTSLEAIVEQADVAELVRKVAAEYHAGLTIVGRGHAHRFLGRWRTNVIAILRESPCPVLSL